MKRRTHKKDLSGLYFMLATMAVGGLFWLYGEFPRKAEAQDLISPLASIAPAQKPAVESITQPAPEVAIEKVDVIKLVDAIHYLESSRGKAKIGLQSICAERGESNEYGYGGMALKICFRNNVEAKARVTLWIVERLAKYNNNVGRTLCSYNLGDNDEQAIAGNCKYYQDYLKIK